MREPVILRLVGMIFALPRRSSLCVVISERSVWPHADQRIALFFFCGGRIIDSSATSTDPHKRRQKAESNQGHGSDKKKYVHHHSSWSRKPPLQWGEVLRRAPRRELKRIRIHPPRRFLKVPGLRGSATLAQTSAGEIGHFRPRTARRTSPARFLVGSW